MIAPDLRKANLEQGSWCADRPDLIMTPPWKIEKVQDLSHSFIIDEGGFPRKSSVVARRYELVMKW